MYDLHRGFSKAAPARAFSAPSVFLRIANIAINMAAMTITARMRRIRNSRLLPSVALLLADAAAPNVG